MESDEDDMVSGDEDIESILPRGMEEEIEMERRVRGGPPSTG